jgi:hypothetical protein
VDRFIQATRDSGYRGTASAIAELVDNALQAEANQIHILIGPDPASQDGNLRVEILDNGSGMDAVTLQQALRFGGSSRFNDRRGLGRYGMGLPNGSLSQARRLNVLSWQSPRSAYTTYLDLDEIVSAKLSCVPRPMRVLLPGAVRELKFSSGTVVTWTRCDRLDYRRASTIAEKVRSSIGRIFRYFLWDGVRIEVNGEAVEPIDPLFVHECSLARGGRLVGQPLEYQMEVPLPDGRGTASGRVIVKFSELPVEEWHQLPNDQKRELGVLNGAGVSIIRARREIEYGWLLMGDKRKENYDDWWRCEVSFDPGLDEVFGITHTKQQIRPTQSLVEAIVPDLEAMAKTLNRRIRQLHEQVKLVVRAADAERIAAARDRLLPPLAHHRSSPLVQQTFEMLERRHPHLALARQNGSGSGVPNYSIVLDGAEGTRFFTSHYREGQLVLVLNTDHPFYRRVYAPLSLMEGAAGQALRQHFDLVLLAAARAEATDGRHGESFLRFWSDVIATFLQS